MQRKKKPLPFGGRGYEIIIYFLNFFYPFSIEMALFACSSVIPSYELVKMKCATWESRITYSSSMITYLVLCFPCSDNYKVISCFLQEELRLLQISFLNTFQNHEIQPYSKSLHFVDIVNLND